MSFQKVYYFVVKKGEIIHCDECTNLIKEKDRAYIIVPHCRDDEGVDFMLCSYCRNKA